MASLTRIQLENWLKTIDVKGSVLDVGGSQNPIKGRTKSWDVNKYKILDLEQPHKGEKPDIICDIQYSIDNLVDSTSQFDNIFCIEVSEYWYNPLMAIENINQLLKKGGLLFISFHFIYPQHPPIGLDYLRYTPIGVEKLLTEAGFEIIDNQDRILENSSLIPIWSQEGMRGWKEFDNQVIGSLITARKK